uniref:Uncharacterized protein n=1 Tax=Arundo donax TaxID=35708 RepID=A0A0A9HFM1_ARUDO
MLHGKRKKILTLYTCTSSCSYVCIPHKFHFTLRQLKWVPSKCYLSDLKL